MASHEPTDPYIKFLESIVQSAEREIAAEKHRKTVANRRQAVQTAHFLCVHIITRACQQWTVKHIQNEIFWVRQFRRYGEGEHTQRAYAMVLEIQEEFGSDGLAYLINEEDRGWASGDDGW